MPKLVAHTIHHRHHHWAWDRSLEPVARVSPGATAEFKTLESSGGQIHAGSTAADVAALDFSRVNPVTGPVFVDGARPGDVLRISVLRMTPSGWGWAAVIPGFGLLADEFPEPALRLWSYEPAAPSTPANIDGVNIPLKPMVGSIGLAPAAPGRHDILPPRRVGGTMDIKDLGVGTVLYLPVEVEGGLLSLGDTHAAQGDGEVCGTGLESAIDVELLIELIADEPLAFPRFEVFGPVSAHLDSAGYHVTTGIGPDLMTASRDCVKAMIDLVTGRYGISPADAYMISSLCGDLRISEVVDRPSWIVSFYLPRSIFK